MIVISNYQTMTCTEHSASAMNRCLLAIRILKLGKIKLTWIERILEVRISCLLWHNNSVIFVHITVGGFSFWLLSQVGYPEYGAYLHRFAIPPYVIQSHLRWKKHQVPRLCKSPTLICGDRVMFDLSSFTNRDTWLLHLLCHGTMRAKLFMKSPYIFLYKNVNTTSKKLWIHCTWVDIHFVFCAVRKEK